MRGACRGLLTHVFSVVRRFRIYAYPATEDQGYQAARQCAINAISQLKAAAGDLDRVRQIVKVDGYVHTAPGFRGHPQVLNGASELIRSVFGERGRHARLAVGIDEMPLNAAVQICVTAEIEDYPIS